MKPASRNSPAPAALVNASGGRGTAGTWFAAALGALLGLSLLKFGNPIILDHLIDPPADIWEYLFLPWPLRWGYCLLLACAGLGLAVARFKTAVPRWVLLLPCLWLAWQFFSSAQSIDPALTRVTLLHFAAAVLCFFLGLFCLGAARNIRLFWIGLLLGTAVVLWTGFEQHYGGLDATRAMFYQQPNWQQSSPDYIKKLQSNRIFSTLVYPNALAAALLLLIPALLLAVWNVTNWLSDLSRAVLLGLLAYAGLACLFWSGSKSGWLIAVALLLVVALKQRVSRRLRITIVAVLLAGGVTGFFIKYSAYFHKGAPSVSARFEYWRAAVRTAAEHPILGTGPGTFSVSYRKIKPPGVEMAQLAHNDYLEQACDSGVLGFLTYGIFILGSIALLGNNMRIARDPQLFAVWLGLLGWTLQSFVEFLLYIPAVAWTAFALMGLLWARATETDGEHRVGP